MLKIGIQILDPLSPFDQMRRFTETHGQRLIYKWNFNSRNFVNNVHCVELVQVLCVWVCVPNKQTKTLLLFHLHWCTRLFTESSKFKVSAQRRRRLWRRRRQWPGRRQRWRPALTLYTVCMRWWTSRNFLNISLIVRVWNSLTSERKNTQRYWKKRKNDAKRRNRCTHTEEMNATK